MSLSLLHRLPRWKSWLLAAMEAGSVFAGRVSNAADRDLDEIKCSSLRHFQRPLKISCVVNALSSVASVLLLLPGELRSDVQCAADIPVKR
ncbi:MAG: hypothetical protein HGA47_06495 [Zoogloea sp.]|nr:hypothetical protein [Zoogloea sp.]